jgi:hypothetical protein
MSRRDRCLVALHGSTLLVIGFLAGIPYGSAIVGGWGDEAVRAWKLAHMEGITNGLLVLAVAGVGGLLELGPRSRIALLLSLLVGGWANTVGGVVAALVGARGLDPKGPADNWIVFPIWMLGFLPLVALPLAIRGAWLARAREAK